MTQERFNDKEKDIRGVQKQSSELLSIAWQKGYQAGFDDGYATRRDAEIIPQSEWIDEGQYAEGHSEHAYTCKNCGYQIIVKPNMIFEERYCKYCGAEMKNTDPIIKAIQENNAKYDERPNIDFSRISYDLGEGEKGGAE